MNLPKEDIPTIQNWIKQNESSNFDKFFAYMINDLKFKVTEMHVKFERSNNLNEQHEIEPIEKIDASSGDSIENGYSMQQETDLNMREEEYEDAGTMVDMEVNQKSIQGELQNHPTAISMVMGPDLKLVPK